MYNNALQNRMKVTHIINLLKQNGSEIIYLNTGIHKMAILYINNKINIYIINGEFSFKMGLGS